MTGDEKPRSLLVTSAEKARSPKVTRKKPWPGLVEYMVLLVVLQAAIVLSLLWGILDFLRYLLIYAMRKKKCSR